MRWHRTGSRRPRNTPDWRASAFATYRADRFVHYEKVAQVMALAAKAGLVRIGFVSDPEK